jgi:xanthine/CO dehydrogenase XdhC/CoxF family maturation factor
LFEAFAPDILPELMKLDQQNPTAWRHDSDSLTLPVPAESILTPDYDASAKRLYLPEANPQRAFYLYGAGHIGRAVMAVTSALDLDRYWIDDDAVRFPDAPAPDITLVPAKDMVTVARHAPKGAFHLVMTYSHRLDEAIVHALLQENSFARLGLIGSATKASRFRSSLSSAGIASSALDRLTCPVGLPQIKGKSPPIVALSIAAQMAVWLNERDNLPSGTG